jgi:uroporphyrinogen decarboxylase
MTPYERTMVAIDHNEPDRVPLFLLLSFYGAKELQVPIKEYFSKVENVVRAQLTMKDKYKNDCVLTFFYSGIEIEAFGGEVIFVDDGPPNTGEPIIKTYRDILKLEVPKIEDSQCLQQVLKTTEMLKMKIGNYNQIIGTVISPFTLPVMQMGFEKYLDLLYYEKDYFIELMRINENFCVMWANAQLAAGASAICYANPLASPNIIERELYLSTGYQVDKRTISKINGITAMHLASGIALPGIDDIISTGASAVGFSSSDNLTEIKKASKDKICLIGNLNALEMVHWNSEKVESEVKNVIAKAGIGGGLILSDNHGEIPWQVPEDVLFEISEAVQRFGTYPLKWV